MNMPSKFSFLINVPKHNIRKFSSSKFFSSNAAVRWTQPNGRLTDIFIHNHITQTKVPFIPKSNEFITWYVCGPTVYDSAHIGHACTYIRFDIIRRILEKFTDMKVVQVMCVTDIDDKIIERARELNTDWKTLSRTYENEFFSDLSSLNVKTPSIVSRATDFIPQMMKFVQNLIEKDIAYTSVDGSVYFSVDKYGKHGKFRKTSSPESTASSPKKNMQDFSLWKNAKPNEPSWEAPWSRGRPGWHLECSTIASEYFGNTVDLHSGAIDLMFPHHENEESQCCAFHNVDQWVNYWLHTGHLHSKSDKMSKSLKNTISIREYLRKNSSNHLRMLCLYTNYRTHVDFDGEEIMLSMNMCTRFCQFFDECRAYVQGFTSNGDIDSSRLLQALNETKEKIPMFLKDDFDTRSSICALTDLMTLTNSMMNAKKGNRCVMSVCLVQSYVEDYISWLGLDFSNKNFSKVKTEESLDCINNIIDNSVLFRTNVRSIALSMKDPQSVEMKNKLLNLCDQFRAEYYQHGIAIKDRKNDTCTWSYVKYEKNEDKNVEKRKPKKERKKS